MRLSVSACAPYTAQAQALAQSLALPFEAHPGPEYTAVLTLSAEGLSLQENKAQGLQHRVDFIKGRMGYRRQALRNELLGQALGLRKHPAPAVLDLSAGWGSDAFLMAALGCTVTTLERNPIVHALLADGLARAQAEPELAPMVARLQLVQAEAQDYLNQVLAIPQVIYYDPMFPTRKKSASVKKEMVLLQQLLGDPETDESTQVLALALQCGARVVVKRPISAPALHHARHRSVVGRACRFDIYDKS